MTFTVGDRVYSSTGAKSHIIQAAWASTTNRSGAGAVTRCGQDAADVWWYPDKSMSLPLCRKCERFNQ